MSGGDELGHVLIYVTRAEAAELRDVASAVLRDFDKPGFHAHVCSSPDDELELTIAPEG